MSASEKLRALEQPAKTQLDVVNNALRLHEAQAQIVAVVETSEDALIEHSAIYDSDDPHCGECGQAAYSDHHKPGCRSAAAFSALAELEKALPGPTGSVRTAANPDTDVLA